MSRLPNYDPIVVAVALSLYSFNVSPGERAQKIYDHFQGQCLPLRELVRICSDGAHIATELPYPSAVLYVAHALERYGRQAEYRCLGEDHD